jgi:hypothetical protein
MRARWTVILLLVAACGKSDEQKAAEAAAKQMEEAIAAAGAAGATGAAAVGNAIAAGALAAGKASDAVDFRVLKELLPEDINGMPRASSDGEKTGAMGFTMSRAEARYQTQGTNASIKIEISDVGAMTGAAAMATYAWATMEVDRENEAGYEKTTTLKGYRGYEKLDRQSNYAELSLMVGGRFMVELEGNEVGMDALKAALDKIDLGKLEGMKGFGVK